ncbi:response regulator transcription factor [Tumidithrix helvetica PCC 7403]|uniref:response regulator transcription factor n=1 Tax=Tumidithrix helvetica TaxID=3457545 RepID=UPI003CBF5332
MKILLVEDDLKTSETLVEALTDQNYVVDVAFDGETGWQMIQANQYSLILLDVMLPQLDGIRLCRSIRSHGFTLPIIMITARSSTVDKVIGLDSGADDFITKPIDLLELFARIRAWQRREQGLKQVDTVLKWENLELNLDTYEVTYNQHPVQLTPKEYALLELMIKNGRRVLSRGAIIENIWDLADSPSEYTVKAHLQSLRNKLIGAGAPDDLIETVRGVGYRLK